MAEWRAPSWLSEALADQSAPPASFPDADGPHRVKAGEIRAIRPMDGGGSARVVLILNDSEDGWANTMLLTNDVEAATNRDVRLDPHETRLPFTILVETDIVGPAFVIQFGPLLGRIDEQLIELLQRVKQGEDSYVLADRRGLPVLSRKEHRVRWKESELQAFHQLAGDCFTELMLKESERTRPLADPAIFQELETLAPRDVVENLLELAKIRDLDVPAEQLREGLGSWAEGLDAGQWAALESIWNGALRESPPAPEEDEAGNLDPSYERGSDALFRCVAVRAAAGERSIPIATRAEFWEGQPERGVVRVRFADGKLVQLSPIFLDKAAA